MGTFSAVLGTAACRPGNIVLATVPSGGNLAATAALLASSFVVAEATRNTRVSASIDGSSSVIAVGKVVRDDQAHVVASSLLEAAVLARFSAASTMGGSSYVGVGVPTIHSQSIPILPTPKLPVPGSVPRPLPPPHNTIPVQNPHTPPLFSGLGVNVKRT